MSAWNGMRAGAKKLGKGHCCYCGEFRQLTLEHLVPTSRGGSKTAIANLGESCAPCNHAKGPLTDDEFRSVMHNIQSLKEKRREVHRMLPNHRRPGKRFQASKAAIQR